jgi:hypothetical protein
MAFFCSMAMAADLGAVCPTSAGPCTLLVFRIRKPCWVRAQSTASDDVLPLLPGISVRHSVGTHGGAIGRSARAILASSPQP